VLLPHTVRNALVAGGEFGRAASINPDAYPAALHLTANHQQPRHYTPYAVITHV